MKPIPAAALGLLAGVTAMWFGGERLKDLIAGGCGCPNPAATAAAAGHAHGAMAERGVRCPARFEGGDFVVDDEPGLQRVRIALRDGVYALWTELGRAPTKDELAARLRLDVKQADALMDTLQACGEQMGGGILRAPQSELIAVAWPFSNLPTGISVTVDGGKTAHARCAIDALGVSQMLGKRAVVEAAAHDDGARKIRVVIDGEQVVEADPKDVVVYQGGSCDEMLFFSSGAAVDEWKRKHNVTDGEQLSLSDATRRGAEIFGRITAGLPSTSEAAAYLASSATTAGVSAPKAVAPWEPVDEAFRACEGGCGARAQTEEAGVIVQTAAAGAATATKIGDRVYCPVSGVVFTVGEQSPKREVEGKRLFFCCESCAQYFSANQARILAARRPAAS